MVVLLVGMKKTVTLFFCPLDCCGELFSCSTAGSHRVEKHLFTELEIPWSCWNFNTWKNGLSSSPALRILPAHCFWTDLCRLCFRFDLLTVFSCRNPEIRNYQRRTSDRRPANPLSCARSTGNCARLFQYAKRKSDRWACDVLAFSFFAYCGLPSARARLPSPMTSLFS